MSIVQVSITEHTTETNISVEENAQTVYVEITECGSISGQGGAASVLLEDIESIGVGTVGAIEEGDILEKGKNMTEVFQQMLQKTVSPTYVSPSSNISPNPSATQEIGDTVNYILTPSFTQNDAGSLSQILIKRDGTTISTQTTTSSFTDSSRIVQAGNVNYSTVTSYQQGDIKNDNFGNPDETGRIGAGSISANISVSGSYYNWFGTSGSQPSQSSNIRSLGSSFSNSFTLNSGSTDNIMVLGIPATKTLVSIIDADALNANITNNYVLSTTLDQVEDGGGNLVAYKVYTLTIATPYSSNHRHNITLS